MRDLDTLGGDKRFLDLLWEAGELHSRKQEDYGLEGIGSRKPDPFANVRASSEFGVKPWVGAFVRLNDKVTRLKAFARKGVLANESAEDSMKDIAVYALIGLILYREEAGADVKYEYDAASRTVQRIEVVPVA
jgi:hypothetical protein